MTTSENNTISAFELYVIRNNGNLEAANIAILNTVNSGLVTRMGLVENYKSALLELQAKNQPLNVQFSGLNKN